MEKKEKSAWWRKKGVLIAAAVLGVLLILWGNSTAGTSTVRTEATATASEEPLDAYVSRLEERIKALCQSVQGVSEVQVAVGLAGDFHYIYATDSDTSEKDGTIKEQTEYITVGSGSSEKTVLLTRKLPEIVGIGVVCRGGGDAGVRQQLVELLSTTYGIGANKIYIAEANR